jgi:hypothetical protein
VIPHSSVNPRNSPQPRATTGHFIFRLVLYFLARLPVFGENPPEKITWRSHGASMAKRRASVDDDGVFDVFLSTWQLGALRRPRDELAVPLDEQVRERRYGIGRYDERRALLRSTVVRLRRQGIDLDVVFRALAIAQGAQLHEADQGRRIDLARILLEERDLIAEHLRYWIQRALRFYGHPVMTWLFDKGPRPVVVNFATQEHVKRVLSLLATDPLWSQPFHVRRRRRHRGRASQPWLSVVRTALRAAKVAHVDREVLLEAAGLIAPRPRR